MAKRVRLILILLSCLGMTGHAQIMYVTDKSETKTIFTINDISKLIFSGGNMTVYGRDGNSEAFASTDIRYLNFTDFSTGIYPSENPEFLILFPNPVQDILNINYKSLGEAVQFEVMTLEGKTVHRRILNVPPGINHSKINVSSLPEGMYLCRLIDGKAVLINKFLKY